jgi:hypothetical protein
MNLHDALVQGIGWNFHPSPTLPEEATMRSRLILALVLLNVALLASLIVPNPFTRSAHALPPLARPSEYLMVSGEVVGGNSGVVFAVDTKNNLLSAFTFDGKKLEPMPAIDLNRAFKR